LNEDRLWGSSCQRGRIDLEQVAEDGRRAKDHRVEAEGNLGLIPGVEKFD
jgi:hypothetical protein